MRVLRLALFHRFTAQFSANTADKLAMTRLRLPPAPPKHDDRVMFFAFLYQQRFHCTTASKSLRLHDFRCAVFERPSGD